MHVFTFQIESPQGLPCERIQLQPHLNIVRSIICNFWKKRREKNRKRIEINPT